MPSAAALRRVQERYRPGVFDRLNQAKMAKGLKRNRLHVAPPPPTPPPAPRRSTAFFGGNGVLDTASPTSEETGIVRVRSINGTFQAMPTGGTARVWRTWVDNSTTGLTTNSATTVWNTWVSAGTMTSAATTYDIWDSWVVGTGGARQDAVWGVWQSQPQPIYRGRIQHVESEEQKKLRAEQAERWRREEEERRARLAAEDQKRKLAEETAIKLLMEVLTDEQADCLVRHGYFLVDAPSGRLYRIDKGTHGNVKVIHRQTRKIVERLCIQPNGVPAGDAMLMQKLLIETAEETFRAHANITLEDGKLVYGDSSPLDGDKLAKVIPIRKAA